MNFEQTLLSHLLTTDFDALLERMMRDRCCQALKEIRAVLDDPSLEDPECFVRIERIVTIFEGLGSNGGSRHDFG